MIFGKQCSELTSSKIDESIVEGASSTPLRFK